MPGHFEDYEDADHHIFYKTIEEINCAQRPSGGIRVNIPRLSNRAKDWLYQPPGCKTVSTATVPKFSFPAFSTDPRDWVPSASGKESSPRMYGDSCIQNWLSQIQQSPAFEEDDDFEIVGSSLGERTPPVMDKPVFEAFPLTTKAMWLKPSYPDPNQEKWNEAAVKWFQHIPSDTEVWLAKGRKKMEQKAAEGDVNNSWSNEQEKPSEISSIMETFFKELPESWLKGEKSKTKSSFNGKVKALDEDCPSKPYWFPLHHAAGNTEWLKQGRRNFGMKEQSDGSTASFFQPLHLEKKKWISSAIDEAKNIPCRHDFRFFSMLSMNSSDWLKQCQSGLNKNNPGMTSFKFHFDNGSSDGAQWLMTGDFPPDSGTTPECHTWKVVQNMHKKMSDADWLLKVQDLEVGVDVKIEKDTSDLDLWNLCNHDNQNDKLSTEDQSSESSLDHWLL
ncbi:uncharacterized protein LOC121378366 isoform X2 [Gigantopelta aegis]|nr:uncharacterized protein LOC121378366 isoform X2 [Gigantopelta aegis]